MARSINIKTEAAQYSNDTMRRTCSNLTIIASLSENHEYDKYY